MLTNIFTQLKYNLHIGHYEFLCDKKFKDPGEWRRIVSLIFSGYKERFEMFLVLGRTEKFTITVIRIQRLTHIDVTSFTKIKIF